MIIIQFVPNIAFILFSVTIDVFKPIMVKGYETIILFQNFMGVIFISVIQLKYFKVLHSMSTQESFTSLQVIYDYHMRDYAMICVVKETSL